MKMRALLLDGSLLIEGIKAKRKRNKKFGTVCNNLEDPWNQECKYYCETVTSAIHSDYFFWLSLALGCLDFLWYFAVKSCWRFCNSNQWIQFRLEYQYSGTRRIICLRNAIPFHIKNLAPALPKLSSYLSIEELFVFMTVDFEFFNINTIDITVCDAKAKIFFS